MHVAPQIVVHCCPLLTICPRCCPKHAQDMPQMMPQIMLVLRCDSISNIYPVHSQSRITMLRSRITVLNYSHLLRHNNVVETSAL